MTLGLGIPATFPEDSCCRLKTRAYPRHPQITSISCTSKLSSIETFPLNNLLLQRVIFYLCSSLSRPSPSVIMSPTISPHLNSISLPTKSWVITSPNLLPSYLWSHATFSKAPHTVLLLPACPQDLMEGITEALTQQPELPWVIKTSSPGLEEKKLLQTFIPAKVNL